MIIQQWHAATTTRHSYTVPYWSPDVWLGLEMLRDIQFGLPAWPKVGVATKKFSDALRAPVPEPPVSKSTTGYMHSFIHRPSHQIAYSMEKWKRKSWSNYRVNDVNVYLQGVLNWKNDIVFYAHILQSEQRAAMFKTPVLGHTLKEKFLVWTTYFPSPLST